MTDREQDYVAFLLYENGSRYMIGIKTVRPHQTIEIDVKALRDNQVPDVEGVTIPLYVSSGQLQWTLRRRDEPARRDDVFDPMALIGRSEQIDVVNGISSNYACQNCCPGTGTFLSGSITPQNYEFDAGSVVQFEAKEGGETCYGYQYPYPYYPGNWSSTNTSVAKVGSSTGIVTMEGPGTAEIKASWSVVRSHENYPCGYLTTSTDGERVVSDIAQEAARALDPQPSIETCGTCVIVNTTTSPQAGLSVRPTVAKVQYQSGSDYVDISNTLYVLKGTTVTFKAVPNPANASFASGRPVWGGSSGATGSGQTKEVTFNTVSTATDDFKIVTAFSGNTKVVNVVVYDLTGVLTPEDNFTGRSTTRFGIHELLTLSFS